MYGKYSSTKVGPESDAIDLLDNYSDVNSYQNWEEYQRFGSLTSQI